MLTTVLVFCVLTVVAADRFMTVCPIRCENGGTCLQSDDGKVTCMCHHDFVGVSCAEPKLVGKTACDDHPCMNGYSCIPISNKDYTCGCSTILGKNCDQQPSTHAPQLTSTPAAKEPECMFKKEYTCRRQLIL